MEMRLSQQQQQHSPHLSPSGHTPTLCSSPSQQPLCHSASVSSGFKWVSDFGHTPETWLVIEKKKKVVGTFGVKFLFLMTRVVVVCSLKSHVTQHLRQHGLIFNSVRDDNAVFRSVLC